MKGNLTRAQLLRQTRSSSGSTGGRGPAGPAGAAGAAGTGVPTGGSTSQVLAKASNTNYDTAWVTPGGVSDGDKGDITVSASGATWTIDAGAVTLSKVVNIAANSILGNNTGAPATAIELTPAQVKALLAIAAGDVSGLGTLATQSGTFSGTSSGTNTGDQTITLTGDVTGAGTGSFAATIANDAVTYAKMQNVSANSFLANATGSPADVQEIATTRIPLFAGAITGTPSGTTYLRGDGAWATVSASDPDGYTYIVKSANQDVTNAGVTADTEFTFAVVAGGHYAISMDLIVSGSDTTGDFTMDFQVSAGTMRGKGTVQNLTSAAAVQNIIITAAAAANTTAIVTGAPTANIDDLVFVRVGYAFVQNTTGGTLTFRFGNAAAASGRISRVWKGSIMRYKRLD